MVCFDRSLFFHNEPKSKNIMFANQQKMPAVKKKSKKVVKRKKTARKRVSHKAMPKFHPQYYSHSQPYPQQYHRQYHQPQYPYANHPYARYPYLDPVYGYYGGYGGLLHLGMGLNMLKGTQTKPTVPLSLGSGNPTPATPFEKVLTARPWKSGTSVGTSVGAGGPGTHDVGN